MTSINKLTAVLLGLGCMSPSAATSAETLPVQQNEVVQWRGRIPKRRDGLEAYPTVGD